MSKNRVYTLMPGLISDILAEVKSGVIDSYDAYHLRLGFLYKLSQQRCYDVDEATAFILAGVENNIPGTQDMICNAACFSCIRAFDKGGIDGIKILYRAVPEKNKTSFLSALAAVNATYENGEPMMTAAKFVAIVPYFAE